MSKILIPVTDHPTFVPLNQYPIYKIKGLDRPDIMVVEHDNSFQVAIQDPNRPHVWFHLGNMYEHYDNPLSPKSYHPKNDTVDQWLINIIPYLETIQLTKKMS